MVYLWVEASLVPTSAIISQLLGREIKAGVGRTVNEKLHVH